MLFSIFVHPKTRNEQKGLIASRIKEQVSECSPGFTNCVNYLIIGFNMPKNMAELLAQVRFNLVDRIASRIAANNPQGIHVHNRVIEASRIAGFGVWAINTNDLFLRSGSSNLAHDAIIRSLQTGFHHHFQLFALLNSLREQIETLLATYGYQGKRALINAYTKVEYEAFYECIERFIPIPMNDLFEIDSVSGKITNIDWRQVKRALLQKLRGEHYVTLSNEEEALLDGDSKNLIARILHGYELVQCLEFFSEWPIEQKEALALAYLKNKSFKEQKEILTILHSESPQLTVQLKKNRICKPFIFPLRFPKTI
jgi:hypothetical protein